MLVSLALLSTAIYCYVHGYQTSSPATQLLGAFILGVFFWQTAFMGHDAGHTGITHNRFYDTIFGVVVGPLLTGISIGNRKVYFFIPYLIVTVIEQVSGH